MTGIHNVGEGAGSQLAGDAATRASWSISVVIPVYRAEAAFPELHRRLGAVLDAMPGQHEIIFVEDAGGDGCWNLIKAASERDPRVRGLHLSRNYGQHSAILCGIRHAKNPVIVTLDDDLQHPPEVIPDLIRELESGFDVVYGVPDVERHGFFRDAASKFIKRVLAMMMGSDTARSTSAFRAFKTELRGAFEHYRGSFVSIDVLLSWATTNFGAITVREDERVHGTSGYTFIKLVRHALNMITGFTTLPLQLASWVGAIFTVFGVGVLGYVIIKYLSGADSPAGFPFLASIIAIFSGAQLFALGILGEYLARMHDRALDRPVYVVRETTFSQGFGDVVKEPR